MEAISSARATSVPSSPPLHLQATILMAQGPCRLTGGGEETWKSGGISAGRASTDVPTLTGQISAMDSPCLSFVRLPSPDGMAVETSRPDLSPT